MITTSDSAPHPAATGDDVLLETTAVSKIYQGPARLLDVVRRAGRPKLVAVDGVSIAIRRGRTLGVVGETGSGKSTLGRLVLGLEPPTSGAVTYLGRDLNGQDRRAERAFRRDVQVVLQDPYTSLNPHRTVGQTLDETLKAHGTPAEERRAAAEDLLRRVGLPVTWVDRRPGQLSGGGRQRVSIARALAVQPRIVVADEPVSALDVSVQAQVLNLFADLQAQLGLAYLFITHDLAVVRRLADDIAVMYLGRVVEQGPAAQVLDDPAHPYTRALLAAAPVLGRRRQGRPAVTGELPDPMSPPVGCSFHTRCPAAMDICREVDPATVGLGAGHDVACHLHHPAAVPAPTDPPRSKERT